MIYLDNAATSYRKPDGVYEAVLQAMKHSGNSDRGVNEASLFAGRTVYHTRELLAELFHAEDPSRIAFTMNSTEALNTAIKGVFQPGDHVITTVLEHNSVLRPLYEMEKRGVELSIIGCDPLGNLLYEECEKAVRTNTRGIVCTHGSNLTGNLIDLKRIGAVAKKYGLYLIVDASQTAGVFDIDVQENQIDILCFTGHKSLMGPQGTGGLYVRSGISVRPLKTGGSGIRTFSREHPEEMPTALEAGTQNTHGIAGLGAGVAYIKEMTPEKIRKKELELMWQFYHGISGLENLRFYGDYSGKERCPIVTLNIGEYQSSRIGDWLSMDYDIAVRTGGHCAPLMHKALGSSETGAVRFSFSCFNTEEEVETAVQAIYDLAK